jgi:hypothetical protein
MSGFRSFCCCGNRIAGALRHDGDVRIGSDRGMEGEAMRLAAVRALLVSMAMSGSNSKKGQFGEDGDGIIIFVMDGGSTGFGEDARWFDRFLRVDEQGT